MSTLPTPPFPRDGLGRAVVLGAALLVLGLLAVRLADVLLMAFGAVLVAVLLHAVAGPLQRWARLGQKVALTAAVFLILAALALVVWAFGRQAEAQFASLSELLPRAWTELHHRLDGSAMGQDALRRLDSLRSIGWLVNLGPRLAAEVAAAAAGTVIVVFAGLYLAFHPGSYFGGVLLLFPRSVRPRVREIFVAAYVALKQWLVGQMFSMLLVGVTTGVGLAIAGVPSAIALGIIAGIGQFVPVIGPMAATVPGLLVSLEAGPETFFWAAVVYFGASQLEANLITPLVLRQLAQLPMAVTLFAVLAMGVLLGPLGVVFATPLAVVTYVLVKMAYVEGLLGEPPSAPATKR